MNTSKQVQWGIGDKYQHVSIACLFDDIKRECSDIPTIQALNKAGRKKWGHNFTITNSPSGFNINGISNENPDPNSNNYGLSQLDTITLKLVTDNIDESWHWGQGGLSSNSVITPEFIRQHPEREWYYGNNGNCGLSSNVSPFITDIVTKYPDKSWEWGQFGLSSNPSINTEFVSANLDKKWHLPSLENNPGVRVCSRMKFNIRLKSISK